MVDKKWHVILAEVTELIRSKEAIGRRLWFRGQEAYDWSLRSSLHRYLDDQWTRLGVKLADAERVKRLDEQARSFYYKFRASAWPLLQGRERSPWGIVFSMQHHGVPTRLIDWTESFACALFFAQRKRRQDGRAAVFILDPEGLNAVSRGWPRVVAVPDEDEFLASAKADLRYYHPGWARADPPLPLSPVAVAPLLSNPRMMAQRAAFMLAGDSFEPIEEQYKGQDVLWKTELPADTYSDVDDFLKLASVGPFGYFPDLSGLADEVLGRR